MNKTLTLAAAGLTFVLNATGAAADGEIAVIIGNDPVGTSFGFAGSYSMPIGGAFGAQFDTYSVADGTDSQIGSTVHLTFAPAQNFQAGAYVNAEDYQGTLWYALGLEAAYERGPVRVAGSYSKETTSPWTFDSWRTYGIVSVAYDLGNGLTGEFANRFYYGGNDYPSITLSKTMKNGVMLSGTAMNRSGQQVLMVSLGKKFGNGATFRRPDYTSLFGLW